jgi:hypothetical protein
MRGACLRIGYTRRPRAGSYEVACTRREKRTLFNGMGRIANHLVDASNGDERDGSSTATASPTHASFQRASLNRFAGFRTLPSKFIPPQFMIRTWQYNHRASTFAESTANRVSASAASVPAKKSANGKA